MIAEIDYEMDATSWPKTKQITALHDGYPSEIAHDHKHGT